MSVDARELRIDNEVFYFNTYSTVVQIDGFNNLIGIAGLGEMVKPEFLDPIPLTKEIIEKCGGEYSIGENYSMGEKFRILFAAPGITLIFYDRSLRVKVDYVHQFQNLIYALTGTEINLTL